MAASRLAGLQQRFQASLLEHGDYLHIERSVIGTLHATAGSRFGVYADAYRMRLEDALTSDFEALHGLLGDEQFHDLCQKYIVAHPSRHFSLRYFGQHMGNFLRRTEPYATQGILAELADFEWTLIDAFDARDDVSVTIADLSGISLAVWPWLCFVAHDSLYRFELEWNVPSIWLALKAESELPEPQRNILVQAWIIWRQGLITYFRSVTPQEAWALDALRAGREFAGLCAGLCEWVGEEQAAITAARFLHRWVSDGLISRIIHVNPGG